MIEFRKGEKLTADKLNALARAGAREKFTANDKQLNAGDEWRIFNAGSRGPFVGRGFAAGYGERIVKVLREQIRLVGGAITYEELTEDYEQPYEYAVIDIAFASFLYSNGIEQPILPLFDTSFYCFPLAADDAYNIEDEDIRIEWGAIPLDAIQAGEGASVAGYWNTVSVIIDNARLNALLTLPIWLWDVDWFRPLYKWGGIWNNP